MPGAGNPQSWNRYAYVANNPINFNDPSGHMRMCPDGDCGSYPKPPRASGENDIKEEIGIESERLSKRVSKNGTYKALDALSDLSDFSASYAPNCASCLIENMGAVVTGLDDGEYAWSEFKQFFGSQEHGTYYRENVFGNGSIGQTGYDPIFQDPEYALDVGGGNQARHFWFYVQVGYESGETVGNAGTILHETIITGNPKGNSLEDLYLGYEGVKLGVKLYNGDIKPSEVGGYIKQTLSPGSNPAQYYSQHVQNVFTYGKMYPYIP